MTQCYNKLKAFRKKGFTIDKFVVPRLLQGFSIAVVTCMNLNFF